MDLSHLEGFVRVAELRSINRAAANLHLSQPALSRQIAALEHEMGAPLFHRSASGVQLTEAGQLLADRVRPLLRQFSLIKEQVGERAAGQLALGTPPAWQHVFTADFVRSLIHAHPGIAVRVHEGMSNVLRDLTAARLLDLAVVPYDVAPVSGYTQTLLVREPLVLVGPPSVALQQDSPVPLQRLEGQPLVMAGRPNVARVQIERAMERKGMRMRLAAESDALQICLALVRREVGCAIVPASSVYGDGSPQDGLCWAPIRGQYVTWALLENVDRGHSRAVREAKALLLRTLESALERRSWPGAEAASRPPSESPLG